MRKRGKTNLEVAQQICEGREFKQVLADRRVAHRLMFEHPSEIMWNEDGMKSSTEGGIDV
jgi:hypothetical protein